MLRSAEIDKIVSAIAQAKPHFGKIPFDKEGQRNKYVSYGAMLNCVEKPLYERDVIIVASYDQEKQSLDLRLLHGASQQYIGTYYPVYPMKKVDDDNQKLGGGITYAKRYALAALLGLQGADENDPDNAPETNNKSNDEPQQPAAKTRITEQQRIELLQLLAQNPEYAYLLPDDKKEIVNLPVSEYEEIKSIVLRKK